MHARELITLIINITELLKIHGEIVDVVDAYTTRSPLAL